MSKVLSVIALSCVVALASCKKDDPAPAPAPSKAKVMFAHTTISADTLKLQINNTDVSGARLAFLGTTGYLSIDPGTSLKTNVLIANSNLPLKDTNITYTVNKHYSVFATGAVTKPDMVVTEDDLSAPAAGNAKVRFINLSPDDQNQSFFVGSNTIGAGVRFRQATAFSPVAAGSFRILAQDPTDPTNLVSKENVQFSAGKIYTVILTGIKGGANSAALNVTVVSND